MKWCPSLSLQWRCLSYLQLTCHSPQVKRYLHTAASIYSWLGEYYKSWILIHITDQYDMYLLRCYGLTVNVEKCYHQRVHIHCRQVVKWSALHPRWPESHRDTIQRGMNSSIAELYQNFGSQGIESRRPIRNTDCGSLLGACPFQETDWRTWEDSGTSSVFPYCNGRCQFQDPNWDNKS